MMYNNNTNKMILVVFVLSILSSQVSAGPIAYAICQTGCNALAVSCYAAAGVTMGTSNYTHFDIYIYILSNKLLNNQLSGI